MSRIFEALQKSPSGQGAGFADLAAAFQIPAELETNVAPAATETLTAPPAQTAGLASTVHMERDGFNGDRLEETGPDRDVYPRVHISLPNSSRVVCLTDKESLGAEKFRFLSVRLRQLQQSRAIKRILITSTIPEEGKSTISANLSITLARKSQHKVLLVDGDLRRPSLSRVFGLGPLPGLSEWLTGDSEAPDPVYRLDGTGLWFIPAGLPPENPLELLQSPRLGELLERLSSRFTWIVVDSPPVLPLADTSVWSKCVDGVFLVAREGTTQKRQLQRGLQTLDNAKLLGVILNGSNNTDHKKYYQRYGPATSNAMNVSNLVK